VRLEGDRIGCGYLRGGEVSEKFVFSVFEILGSARRLFNGS